MTEVGGAVTFDKEKEKKKKKKMSQKFFGM